MTQFKRIGDLAAAVLVGKTGVLIGATVSIACLIAFLGKSFLFYEGAEIFISAAENGFRSSTLGNSLRATWWIPQLPLLILRHYTQHPALLALVFGAPFVVFPALTVWRVVVDLHSNPRARALALLGLCVIPLPWQQFWLSQWSIVNQLAWLLLACLAGPRRSRSRQLAIPVLFALLFLTHPLSFLIFTTLGATTLVLRWHKGKEREPLSCWTGLTFLSLGLFRLTLVFTSSRERSRLNDLMGESREELVIAFKDQGFELLVLFFLAAAAAAVALTFRRHTAPRWALGFLAVAAVGLAGFYFVNPHPWLAGIHYHYWSFVVLAVVFVAFLSEISRKPMNDRVEDNTMALAAWIPALLFLLVVSNGTSDYRSKIEVLLMAVDASETACVEFTDLPPRTETAVDNPYFLAFTYLAESGTAKPTHLLSNRSCQGVCWDPGTDASRLFDFESLPPPQHPDGKCPTQLVDGLIY